MSQKYTPTFLKGQPTTVTNMFSSLADDITKEKPIVNTSLPAKEAPKFVPATLASITSNGAASIANSDNGTGPKRTFADKFAEQAKIKSNPNYVPPPKPVNLTSKTDFPTLGKNITVEPSKKPTTVSFAEKAKEWAKIKKDEDDAKEAEEARLEALRQDALKRNYDNTYGLGLGIGRFKGNRDTKNYKYDDEYSVNDDDDDSYESPEDNVEPSDEEDYNNENEYEVNQNIAKDGRRRDDLY